jgi:tripartite-type tricarboxylate transporter receptor subunit TctC
MYQCTVRFVLFLGLLLSAGSVSAQVENYPTKPITLVVPSSPGGPADVAARLIVDRMSESLGQTIVIETVAGAGGTIGMGRVARAAPDGYTLMIHQTGFAITPAIYNKLNFDTAKDFTTIGLVNHTATLLCGRTTLPVNTYAELEAWIKGPGKPVRYAHPGPGSSGHLTVMMHTKAMGGVEISAISYRGIAPAVNDMLGGHIDIASVSSSVALPLIKAGKLKVFATGGMKRSAALPDVPTFGEVGHKELERAFWHALFAPAATPRPILEKLNAALRETLRDPKVVEGYARSSVEAYPPETMSIEASHAYVQKEIALWARVVKENDLKVEAQPQ